MLCPRSALSVLPPTSDNEIYYNQKSRHKDQRPDHCARYNTPTPGL